MKGVRVVCFSPTLEGGVVDADPEDPYDFGPPGSRSFSSSCKNSKKNLDF
jgi:hypothetical protein